MFKTRLIWRVLSEVPHNWNWMHYDEYIAQRQRMHEEDVGICRVQIHYMSFFANEIASICREQGSAEAALFSKMYQQTKWCWNVQENMHIKRKPTKIYNLQEFSTFKHEAMAQSRSAVSLLWLYVPKSKLWWSSSWYSAKTLQNLRLAQCENRGKPVRRLQSHTHAPLLFSS